MLYLESTQIILKLIKEYENIKLFWDKFINLICYYFYLILMHSYDKTNVELDNDLMTIKHSNWNNKYGRIMK